MADTSVNPDEAKEEVISVCLRTARQYGKQGSHEQAINILKNALNLAPDNTEVLLTLAAAYLELERYDDALPLLKSAHRLEPQRPTAVEAIGHIFASTGRWDEAIEQIGTLYPLDQNMALKLFYNVFSGFNSLLFNCLLDVSNKYSNRE